MAPATPRRSRWWLSALRPSRLWRTVAYLASGAAVGLVALLGLPFVMVLGGLVAAPLAAIPLGALERRRLALLGGPALPSPHRRPAASGLESWLRLRYTEAATWRELAYTIVLATLLWPVNAFAAWLAGGLAYVTFIDPVVDPASGQRWLISLGLCVPFVGSLYLASAVAAGHAALARALLGGGVEQAVRELTRSRARLIDAFEIERRRIERDLHDGAQQHLVALTLTLGMARLEVDGGPPAARRLIDQATEQAGAALDELRRLIRGIHPQVLTDHGLPAAIAELADRSPVPARLDLALPERLPSTVESTAYFVVAEALTNAAKHAGATVIAVTGTIVDNRLVVRVRDNGGGGADPARGSGLAGLADRVAALDGTLTITSPPGGPTILHLELPCSAS
jgi:signal transduction histidine kinase